MLKKISRERDNWTIQNFSDCLYHWMQFFHCCSLLVEKASNANIVIFVLFVKTMNGYDSDKQHFIKFTRLILKLFVRTIIALCLVPRWNRRKWRTQILYKIFIITSSCESCFTYGCSVSNSNNSDSFRNKCLFNCTWVTVHSYLAIIYPEDSLLWGYFGTTNGCYLDLHNLGFQSQVAMSTIRYWKALKCIFWSTWNNRYILNFIQADLNSLVALYKIRVGCVGRHFDRVWCLKKCLFGWTWFNSVTVDCTGTDSSRGHAVLVCKNIRMLLKLRFLQVRFHCSLVVTESVLQGWW